LTEEQELLIAAACLEAQQDLVVLQAIGRYRLRAVAAIFIVLYLSCIRAEGYSLTEEQGTISIHLYQSNDMNAQLYVTCRRQIMWVCGLPYIYNQSVHLCRTSTHMLICDCVSICIYHYG